MIQMSLMGLRATPFFVAQLGLIFHNIRVLCDPEGAQFEDVGAGVELFWGHVVLLLFWLHARLF